MTDPGARERGWLPAAAIGVYLLIDWLLLPAAPRHLAYLLSAETGAWAPSEFAHPLFVPVLSALGAGLRVFGWNGHLLVPAQGLNLLAAGLTLWLLFRLAELASGDRTLSLLCALAWGLSKGYWLQHARPMPYSLAALCAVGALYAAVAPRRRMLAAVLSGALAAAASLFTLAGVSLVPVLAWLARRRDHAAGRRARAAALLLSVFVVVSAAGFAFFLYFHRIEPAGVDWRELFGKVEQVRGSSIWSSRSVVKQAADFAASLRSFFDLELLVVLAVAVLRRRKRHLEEEAKEAAAGLAGGAALFALFFLINNTQNGFICVSGMALGLVAALAPGDRVVRAALLAALLSLGGRAALERGASRLELNPWASETEPVFLETSFLRQALRPSDVLLVPAAPEPGFDYFFTLNTVEVSDERLARTGPAALRLDGELLDRTRHHLGRGQRVFLAAWRYPERERGSWELFSHELGGEAQAAKVERIQAFLGRRFRMGRPLRSPNGQAYFPLAMKRSAPAAAPVALSGGWDPKWPASSAKLLRFKAILAADPGDAYAFCDLADAFREAGLSDAAEAALERAWRASPALQALVGRRRELWAARDHHEKSMRLFVSGDGAGALLELDRALRLDPDLAEALLSRAALLDGRGLTEKALKDYDRFISLGPTGLMLADALAGRAGVLEKLGRPKSAAKDLEQALAASPADWRNRAVAEAALGKLKK